VKYPFRDELLSRIAAVTDPCNVDYVASNHSELDHSGCLPEIIKDLRPEKVFTSLMGVKSLNEHFRNLPELIGVKDGGKIDLGNMSLTVHETKMLHWPESMIAFLDSDKVLFSQDAFGMHLASTERFDDEIDETILKREAAKYFANILLPFAPRVRKILPKLEQLNLDPAIIATDHGPLWRKDKAKIMQWYAEWAEGKPFCRALILYDSMWESTSKMAHAITDGLLSGDVQAKVIPIRGTHRSDIATELLTSSALIIGSPTLNNILTYIKGLKPRNYIGAAFGSYGWSGEAVPQIQEILKSMKIDIAAEGVKVKYVPTKSDLEKCFTLGADVAAKLQNLCTGQD